MDHGKIAEVLGVQNAGEQKAFADFAKYVVRRTESRNDDLERCHAYIRRYKESLDDQELSLQACMRIFIIALLLSKKFDSDAQVKNGIWIGFLYPWLDKSELATMERLFLRKIDYQLNS